MFGRSSGEVGESPALEHFLPVSRFQPSLVFSPDGRELFFSSNRSGQFGVWSASLITRDVRQLTTLERESVRELSVSPDGSEIVFTADKDGDELHQLYSLHAGSSAPQPWAAERSAQHYLDPGGWSPDGSRMAYATNARVRSDMEVWIRDRASGEVRHVFGEGMFAWPVSWSPDGRHLLVQRFLIHTDSTLYLVEVETGEAVELTPHDEEANFRAGPWSADGSGFYLLTNQGREFLGLALYRLADRSYEWIETPTGDIDDIAGSRDGRVLAWVANERGWSRLYARDLTSGRDLPTPSLPAGSLERYTTALTLTHDGSHAAVLWSEPTRPTELYVVETATGRPERITDNLNAAAREEQMRVPEEIEYPSFDGRMIPAFLYRPRRDGPTPVALSLHGGPDFQERPWYQPLYQYLMSRGIAVLAPNFRGSTGYGRTYQRLVQHDWGGAELRDVVRGAEWLSAQDWVDTERIGVFGSSFGGFLTLSCIARFPELWAAAVDIYGPANLLTSTKAMPATWKRFIAQSIGDPETEADFLLERSPVTYVDNICTPLLIIQGANDPRVLPAESEQIVDRLRGLGREVEYTVFDDEGHAFLKRENELRAQRATADWFERHLRP